MNTAIKAFTTRYSATDMNAQLSSQDLQVVRQIISKSVQLPLERITGEAHLTADLGADSLTLIEISMAVEEKFNLSIPDERLEKIATVNDLCTALAEALSPATRPD